MEESSPLVETGVVGVRPRAGTRRRLVAGGVLVTAALFGVAAFAARGTLSARLVGEAQLGGSDTSTLEQQWWRRSNSKWSGKTKASNGATTEVSSDSDVNGTVVDDLSADTDIDGSGIGESDSDSEDGSDSTESESDGDAELSSGSGDGSDQGRRRDSDDDGGTGASTGEREGRGPEENGGGVTGDVTTAPHIVFILIDDQGYNDVGHASTDLMDCTPTIDALGEDGVRLGLYYGQSLCTPSRAAFLTGKYPVNTGMQHSMISVLSPWGLPAEHTLLPTYLKQAANYHTHIVGKWHLGHFSIEHLPLNRGFDTHFGYYSGFESYWSHIGELGSCQAPHCYKDLRRDTKPVIDDEGVYATYLFSHEAVQIIHGHRADSGEGSRPFFLYLALPNVHAPVMVPDELFERHATVLNKIENAERRAFGALTIAADEAVHNVTEALRASGAYDNSVIVIASDNGGNPSIEGSGSNYPLRGMKGDLWEGGVRVHALVHSPRLPDSARGTTYQGLFHASDWLPTLVGGMLNSSHVFSNVKMDGVDQWRAITGESKREPRNELLLNIDDLSDADGQAQGYVAAAIRVGSYKLIMNVDWAPVWPAPKVQDTSEATWPGDDDRIHMLGTYLFNLDDDPSETNDLSTKTENLELMTEMKTKIQKYWDRAHPSAYCAFEDIDDAYRSMDATKFLGPWQRSPDWECPRFANHNFSSQIATVWSDPLSSSSTEDSGSEEPDGSSGQISGIPTSVQGSSDSASNLSSAAADLEAHLTSGLSSEAESTRSATVSSHGSVSYGYIPEVCIYHLAHGAMCDSYYAWLQDGDQATGRNASFRTSER